MMDPFVEQILDEMYGKAEQENAIPWNDAKYPGEGEPSEQEKRDFGETFNDHPSTGFHDPLPPVDGGKAR